MTLQLWLFSMPPLFPSPRSMIEASAGSPSTTREMQTGTLPPQIRLSFVVLRKVGLFQQRILTGGKINRDKAKWRIMNTRKEKWAFSLQVLLYEQVPAAVLCSSVIRLHWIFRMSNYDTLACHGRTNFTFISSAFLSSFTLCMSSHLLLCFKASLSFLKVTNINILRLSLIAYISMVKTIICNYRGLSCSTAPMEVLNAVELIETCQGSFHMSSPATLPCSSRGPKAYPGQMSYI